MVSVLVDTDLCTRCGICSKICPAMIIRPADENTLPAVSEERSGMCITCGHCEAACPSGALMLSFHGSEREIISPGTGVIPADELGIYMKKRRSVRHYKKKPVPRELVESILDIARYAPSGGNAQPVQWLVVQDPEEVRKLAGLTADWMKGLMGSGHPMEGYVSPFIAAWDKGSDQICRGAPHLVIAHVPADNPGAMVDAIIALTYFDLAAPSFGIGTCWAGFLSIAAASHEPLVQALSLPPGRKCAYGLMFGYPQYQFHRVPERNQVQVTWR